MRWDIKGGGAAQSAAIAGIADIARYRRDRKGKIYRRSTRIIEDREGKSLTAKEAEKLKPTPNWDDVPPHNAQKPARGGGPGGMRWDPPGGGRAFKIG